MAKCGEKHLDAHFALLWRINLDLLDAQRFVRLPGHSGTAFDHLNLFKYILLFIFNLSSRAVLLLSVLHYFVDILLKEFVLSDEISSAEIDGMINELFICLLDET